MSVCFRYTNSREEAEEMLNVGFMKILKNLEKYKPEIPFNTWIRRVMINVLIDEYRKEKKHYENVQYVEEYYETSDYSEQNSVIGKMNMEQIQLLILKLPPMSQKVFNLFVIDGYSHKEIGDLLKMSEGTSKWHLNFSRTKLKEMITGIPATIKVTQ